MSATDPLRDALERLANPTTVVRSYEASCLQAEVAATARAALDAVPAAPNSTCVHDAEPKSSGEKLGAPAEPEVWEYGGERCSDCGDPSALPCRVCPEADGEA